MTRVIAVQYVTPQGARTPEKSWPMHGCFREVGVGFEL